MDSREKENLEIAIFNVVKTIFDLASNYDLKLNNSEIFDKAQEIAPEIINKDSLIYTKIRENPLIDLYRQKSILKSREIGTEVKPLELLEADIEENEKLLRLQNKGDHAGQIRREVKKLKVIRPYLRERSESENEWMLRDITIPREIKGKLTHPYSDGRVYSYGNRKNILKIRRLHPDKSEHTLGADLIFEKYDFNNNKLRFVHLQYKIWDNNNDTLYLKKGNIEKQLRKLSKEVCNNNFCCKNSPKSQNSYFDFDYRMPFCCAFLRPTNRIQNSDNRLLTSGIYFPVCETLKFLDTYGKNLYKGDIKGYYLTHDIFEKLFQNNLIGSRWLEVEEVEELYRNHKILQSDENLILHVQNYEF